MTRALLLLAVGGALLRVAGGLLLLLLVTTTRVEAGCLLSILPSSRYVSRLMRMPLAVLYICKF